MSYQNSFSMHILIVSMCVFIFYLFSQKKWTSTNYFKLSCKFFLPHIQYIMDILKLSLYIKLLGEGNGTPLQYSCLENPMDGGAGKSGVHGVAEGQTRLSDFPFTFHFHALEKAMATHSSVLAWRIPGTASLVRCRLWGRTESDTTGAT